MPRVSSGQEPEESQRVRRGSGQVAHEEGYQGPRQDRGLAQEGTRHARGSERPEERDVLGSAASRQVAGRQARGSQEGSEEGRRGGGEVRIRRWALVVSR